MSSAILGGGVAAGAQTEVLNKQLKEAKDTITDQMVVIEELRENFFKVTGELSAEIERLKEINARQTKKLGLISQGYPAELDGLKKELELSKAKISKLELSGAEQIKLIDALTEKYLKVTSGLKDEIASLKSVNLEQEKLLKEITDNYFKVSGKLEDELKIVQGAYAQLKDKDAEREATIKKMTDSFFRVTGELNEQIGSLEATNAEQVATIDKVTDNYFKVTGELNDEISKLKAANQVQADTVKQITDNYFEVTGKLDEGIESLQASNTKLKAKNVGLEKVSDERSKAMIKLTKDYDGQLKMKDQELNKLKTTKTELESITIGQKTRIESDATWKWLLGLGIIAAFFVGGS